MKDITSFVCEKGITSADEMDRVSACVPRHVKADLQARGINLSRTICRMLMELHEEFGKQQ